MGHLLEFVCFVPISDKVQQRMYRYSMTSSARPISAFGTMNALAVLRLITNSYLVGACIESDFKDSEPDRRSDRSDFAGRGYRPLIACDRYCLSSRQYRAAARAHGHRNDVAGDQKGCAMPHGLREAIESYRRRTAAGASENALENYDTRRRSLRRKSTKALSAGRIWRRLG